MKINSVNPTVTLPDPPTFQGYIGGSSASRCATDTFRGLGVWLKVKDGMVTYFCAKYDRPRGHWVLADSDFALTAKDVIGVKTSFEAPNLPDYAWPSEKLTLTIRPAPTERGTPQKLLRTIEVWPDTGLVRLSTASNSSWWTSLYRAIPWSDLVANAE